MGIRTPDNSINQVVGNDETSLVLLLMELMSTHMYLGRVRAPTKW